MGRDGVLDLSSAVAKGVPGQDSDERKDHQCNDPPKGTRFARPGVSRSLVGMLLSYQRVGDGMAVRKVAVTLPEELFQVVERARQVEHRSRSEVIQEALRTHFGEAVYVPTDEERRLLVAALDEVEDTPEKTRDWDEVRAELRVDR